jgi:hypothetical protein
MNEQELNASAEDCRKEYEDWVKLLKEAKAEGLLSDPFAVWEEAWYVARITQK